MIRGFTACDIAEISINSELMFGLTNQALILVCKFLEVWDSTNALAKGDPRIVDMRRAVRPIIERMRVWPGLDSLRNSGLAHAYLDRKGDLVAPWQLALDGRAPSYHAESLLLLHLVIYGSLSAMAPFEAEYTPIDGLAREPSGRMPTPEPGISVTADIEAQVRQVTSKVSPELWRIFGITGGTPLFVSFSKSLEVRRPSSDP